ncbi:MAG: hypothetical protein AMJ46_04745 [Latescibacteria bacterium DG_63]|nr:MAG: hypothetical protein AMJ46_04745 [Latescibacteria bacterium DG_63]
MRKAKSFIAVSIFALFVLAYAHTCSLSVTWKNFSEDSGDLLAAAFTLGIPHPTGYPLYVLLGRTFSLVMPGSIAFRITLLSILCASLAPVFLFLTLARLLPGRGALLGAAFASLSLGFSLHYWSQAVIAEVYALHLLLTSVVVYALVRWVHPEHSHNGDSEKPNTFLLLAAYALGLSFANHMLSLVTLVFGAVLVLSGSGRKKLSLPLCLWTLASFLIPLTLYAYLPLRSMKNPPLDWGNPETWDQLRWVVTGAQYRFRFLGKPLLETLPRLWPGPFLSTGSLVALLALAGLLCGKMSQALRASLAAMLAASLAVVILYDIPDFQAYFLPAVFAISLLAGAGFHRIVDACEVLLQRTRRPVLVRYGVSVAAGLLLLAAIVPAARENRKETDASADLYPYVFGRATFRVVEPDALIVSEYDGRTFALWFFREAEHRETHPGCIVVMKPLLVWPWYIDNLRKLYPDLVVPEAGLVDETAVLLVGSNIDTRPVYAVRDDPTLRQFFELRPVLGGLTPLFRVEKRIETQVPNE